MCSTGEDAHHVCTLGVLNVCAFVYLPALFPRWLLIITCQQRLYFVRAMGRVCRVGRL